MNLLFCDFETYYSTKDKYTLKSMSMTEYIRDPRFKVHGMGFQYNKEEPVWVPEWELQQILEEFTWKKTVLVAHNIKFDGAILKWKYGITPARYVDTQSLARAVLGGLLNGHSLKKLAEYLGLESKGDMKTDGIISLTREEEGELASYCLTDVRICLAIYEKLSPQFPAGQWQAMDWTVRAFINPALELDAATLERSAADEKERREKAVSQSGLDASVLRSNSRFAKVVSELGVAVPTKISGRTGKKIPAFSKSDEGLRSLSETHSVLVNARLAAKSSLLETRCEKLAKIGKTGAFPFDVQFSGATQTHRYSGGGGAGGNPQNFPRTGPIRASVCAPEGHSLCVGDFAQIEARLVAWLANEPKLKNAFTEERDVYSEFASDYYQRPISKKDDKERRFGKESILGLGYGMGWKKFQARIKLIIGVDLPDEDAQRAVKLYRTTYFNIPRLWDNAERLLPLMETGRKNKVPFALFLGVEKDAIVLPSGLKIRYPNLRVSGMKFKKPQWVYDHFVKRYDAEESNIYGGKIIENICQGLAGEICKNAIQGCEAKGIRVVGAVHDEIIAVVTEADVARAEDIVRLEMERSISWLPSLKLKAEVSSAKNWAEAKG